MPGSLDRYNRKRDFRQSPEPRGTASGAGEGPARFVVQEHDATRLHWDLRIEHDGVLASWALPRFIPGTAGENVIAIRTEDHPLDYLTFEGEIPAGSYGAGTMRIYDHGTAEILEWGPRKVEVRLSGERLTGEWALFPLARKGEKGDDWMIHRMGEPLDPGAQPMPEQIAPMLAQTGELPMGRAWAFEVKWDGVRAICRSEPGKLALWSRNANDITAGYPELARLNRALREHRVILDGEIVAFSDGRPSFQALQQRMHVREERRVRRLAREVPVTYVIFDLLWLDGRSLTELPYRERRALLDALELHDAHWQVPEPVQGSGEELMSAAESLGLEGVVAKRLDAPYQPGRRSTAWVKVKRRRSAEFLIGGWIAGEGSRAKRIGALLLGEPDEGGHLRYAGRVGSGLGDAALRDLATRMKALASEVSPFTQGAGDGEAQPPRGAHWVAPELLAEVAFTERSRDGLLRHPVWIGLREDVPMPLVFADERRGRAGAVSAVVRADGHEIAVTNLDKVLYPEPQVAKRAVIEYYAAIAPVMLRHLAGRGLTLKRYPNGVEGQAFFEKRAPAHAPDWIQKLQIRVGSKTIGAVGADSSATLIWLAQLAALELHVPLARAAEPEAPTTVVFDLDPGAPATIVECCQVALLLRAMLAGVGLQCLAKTSGSKGLQLYLPLNDADARFEQTRAFARALAELLAGEEPGLVVATQAKARRKGRVLVDWYQNDPSKTTIGVYSLRAREQPTVSTPVDWEEVEACAQSGDPQALAFTATQVLERVAADGDLFAPVDTLVQRLPAL